MKVCTVAILFAIIAIDLTNASDQVAPSEIRITDGHSIQRALDANPSQIIYLPPGDYEISQAISITHDRSGLVGPGRIIQTDPKAPVIIISQADDVQLRELTLTRKAGQEGRYSGLMANSCDNLILDNLQVLDNCAANAAINLDRCTNSRLSNSLVRNYSRISIDDRTKSSNYGFAFKCIDGTGIQLTNCRGMLLQNNRVVEQKYLPTPEVKSEFELGKFTTKNAEKGALVSQETWDNEAYPTWHQGSAIYVGGPKSADRVQILGNYIENAAQGIDLHADHITVSQNIVNGAGVGMKAMHGSRNILIMGNQFIKCDHCAIQLQPGAGSHAGNVPVQTEEESPARPANVDGGTVVANNIISDFGYGNAHWIWGDERSAIALEYGQKAENPPLRDVVIQGNVVYDPGREETSADGKSTVVPPRYRYAILVTPDSNQLRGPVGIRFSNNVFHPGLLGISNVTIEQ